MIRLLRFLTFAAAFPLAAKAQEVRCTIDATQAGIPIPSTVYGVNDVFFPGSTIDRHGGNRTTGLNWENNASNAGSDYLHTSDAYLGDQAGIGSSQKPGALLEAWLTADRAHQLRSIITVPLAGYVAADFNGAVSKKETAPSPRWTAVKVWKEGPLSLVPNVSDGVVYLDEMVTFLITKFGKAAAGGVAGYCLDNEAALWPSTHPRIHPAKTGCEELVSKQIAAAEMITKLDDSAEIYGPVLYGWSDLMDMQDAPDWGALNQTYGIFANYYLARMKAASEAAGHRLLHRFDLHWYPEARGDRRISDRLTPSSGTERDIEARLQAPRSLWDPTYVESSWITASATKGKAIQLLPRLRESVEQYYPGTGLALTEYNYGAADHISGGVAQADVLGILADFQTLGCFWPIQTDNRYVAASFQLYRNYDSHGSAFGEFSLPASVSENARVGIHAARSANKLTVVVINRSRTDDCRAVMRFKLPKTQTLSTVKSYRLSAASGAAVHALSAGPKPSTSSFPDTLPAMSATLFEVQLRAAKD